MNKKKFNPKEWEIIPKNTTLPFALNGNSNKRHPTVVESDLIDGTADKFRSVESPSLRAVEAVIQQIEAKQIDLTSSYPDWCNIGFGFAVEFAEGGRELFHRVSKYYTAYEKSECDEQYNKCLMSSGSGITIATFFLLAKQANLIINDNFKLKDSVIANLPYFPEILFDNLPAFLREVIKNATIKEERDIMVLGTIVTLSACMHNVYGIYDEKQVHANLFLFVTAPASAGKGRLTFCKQLAEPIHKELREQAKRLKSIYDSQLIEFNNRKQSEDIEKPPKPPLKMLFIPANNSSTGMFQILFDNEGKGLLFETEGDTLAQAFKSDYGNYSDGLRKAFHHETINYFRRKDNELVEIEKPKLSALLSGTPNQIANLIPDAENGLFSRFIFYFMNIDMKWKDVFASNSNYNLENHFNQLATEFFDIYKILNENGKIQFVLTADQNEAFNNFFTKAQFNYIEIMGIEYLATIRRLGLISFRIAMVLSVLRISETGELQNPIICQEQDFNVALSMIAVLFEHSKKVFEELPKNAKPSKQINLYQKFLNALPNAFDRQQYLKIAETFGIIEKTADNHIAKFEKDGLIHRESHNNYKKNKI